MRKMRRLLFALSLLMVVALALGACAPAPTQVPPAPEESEEAAPTAEPVEPAEPFRVAVVMPSAINDLAFSQSMYDALIRIQTAMGADNFEIAYSENMFVIEATDAPI